LPISNGKEGDVSGARKERGKDGKEEGKRRDRM